MTNNSEPLNKPIGIDLGTASTVGALPSDGEYRVLENDEGGIVPTTLALGENGFVIGQEAAEHPDSVTPLPYIERTEQSMTASPSEVPLAIFLEQLSGSWGNSSMCASTTDVGQPVGEDEPGEDDTEGSHVGDSDEEGNASDLSLQFSPGPASATANESEEREDASSSDSRLDDSTKEASFEGYNPTTITVPGGYSAEDISQVESVASAAGFGEVMAVRNPLAIGAAESLNVESKKTIGIADIGSEWAEFAVVTINPPGELSVEARTMLSEHGRDAFDSQLVQWVLKQVEKEYGISIDCSAEAREQLRNAVCEAVGQIDPDEGSTASIEMELSDGVSITDGGMFGMDAIPVEIDLDLDSCVQALRPMLEAIQQSASSMLDGLSKVDIDELVLAGGGTEIAPVLIAVENAFQIRSRPPSRGDRYTAPAIGAAVLSKRRASGTDPIARETISDAYVLKAQSEAGLESREISTTATDQETVESAKLVPVEADQLAGTFQIGFQHRITGNIRQLQTYSCTNIPSSEDVSNVTVQVESSSPVVDTDTVRVFASLETTADRDTELSIQETAEIDHPWLAHAGTDTSEVSVADADDRTLDGRSSTRMKALESVDSAGVARAAWKMRNRIWEQTVRTGENLSQGDVQLFLRELDKNLQLEGVEIIEPETGKLLDTSRHSVGQATETDEPEGTILEVLSPGFAIEGTVIEPAEVRAAK